MRNSLAVGWLGLGAFPTGTPTPSLVEGTEIPQARLHGQNPPKTTKTKQIIMPDGNK